MGMSAWESPMERNVIVQLEGEDLTWSLIKAKSKTRDKFQMFMFVVKDNKTRPFYMLLLLLLLGYVIRTKQLILILKYNITKDQKDKTYIHHLITSCDTHKNKTIIK